MYEPRESRWNLNQTPEYDICREALLAHVYGGPVRSKVIKLEDQNTPMLCHPVLTTGDGSLTSKHLRLSSSRAINT
jgi:hypothetical protein